MKSEADFDKFIRPFKLTHQVLNISSVNFERKSISGHVELHILPLTTLLAKIKLNCKQSRIFRVKVNDLYEVPFQYSDPTLVVCPSDIKQRNFDYFIGAYTQAVNATDPDLGGGELIIKLTSEVAALVAALRPLKIRIDYCLEQPRAGIHFVSGSAEGDYYERGVHLFSYKYENSSRSWFPCVDSFSEPYTWRIEITVPSEFTAIASGDLSDTFLSRDGLKKTFIYTLNIPTSSPNIGMAIGVFDMHVDSNNYDITHFCPPRLLGLLKHSTSSFHQIVEFFVEYLGSQFPFSSYKTVFVDEAYADYLSFSSLTIFSVNLLFSPRIIDQTFISIKLFSTAVADQIFGCFIAMNNWNDAWAVYGISLYLAAQFQRATFGQNEYLYTIRELMTSVCQYEESEGEIVLDNTLLHDRDHKVANISANKHSPCLMSPRYIDMLKRKAHLVIGLIGFRIGNEILIQVFNKLISLASQSSKHSNDGGSWENMLLSTTSLVRVIGTLCGKDLSDLMDQWVFGGGHPIFFAKFNFHRKRNCIELEIRQQEINKKGISLYVGPLTIVLQELDGPFTHVLQIEDAVSKHDIMCHSKSRRLKKKKIPIGSGEEIDMDLSALDADSPVLWLRLDPQMMLIRKTIIEQQDVLWHFMLRYEKDANAQFDAVKELAEFECYSTRQILIDTIGNENFYYRVRMQAIYSLASIMSKNPMMQMQSQHPIVTLFRSIYSSQQEPRIVRLNNFYNLQQYFIQQAFPLAIGLIRNQQEACPSEDVKFILDLLKYNDNRKNKFSDCYYRASLIRALANTISPCPTVITSPEVMAPEMQEIVEEITRILNMEKLIPSYKYTLTISCLHALRKLQRNGHLPNDPTIFKNYTHYEIFVDVRIAGIEALVDFVQEDSNSYIFSYLLEVIEYDPVPYVRHKTLQILSQNPPFVKQEDKALNTELTVEQMWNLLNKVTVNDTRLRSSALDLYYSLYGRVRPSCLPLPELGVVLKIKEKRTEINPNILPEDSLMQGNNIVKTSVSPEFGIESVTTEDFLADREPMYLPSPTEVKSSKKKKKKKHKLKKMHKREKAFHDSFVTQMSPLSSPGSSP